MNTKVLAGVAAAVAITSSTAAPVPKGAKNVVLVHGAYADGSGWGEVASMLRKDGFLVWIVQEPETSLVEDVKATERVLDLQTGPAVLVGHSYGGAVITEAGNHKNVVALVYVAAVQPDSGETTASLFKQMPAASTSTKSTPDGFLYLEPAAFPADFAADIPTQVAQEMAYSQVFVAAANFGVPITTAAWRTKPSWALIAGADRAINPDLERWMAKRANSTVIELKGSSHAAYISHPQEVVQAIRDAAATQASSAAQSIPRSGGAR